MHVFVSVKHKILIRWFCLQKILFKDFGWFGDFLS